MKNSVEEFNVAYEQQISVVLDENDFPKALIEKYIVKECLSVSNTSEVYLIINRNTYMKYVLKVMKVITTTELNEVLLLQELNHKDIPKIIEQYSYGKYKYIIKTYYEGLTLYEYVAQKEIIDYEELFYIIKQLIDILSYLHIQSPPIIHRDIKPENIVYTPEKEVKLIDFDIARYYRKELRYDTVYLGTREYAPPEQFGYSQTDQRTDIYSIGMLMIFMLTGDLEVEAVDTNIKDNRVKKIIHNCIAFAPKDRYANIRQLKKAINKIKNNKAKVIRYIRNGILIIFTIGIIVVTMKLLLESNTIINDNNIETNNNALADTIDEIEILEKEVSSNLAQVISFPDECFEEVIRETINKPIGDITIGDVQGITSLNAEAKNIKSIEGIQYLTKLRELGLWSNEIEEISPLENLTQLEQLFLDGNSIYNLYPLSSLENLFNLGLGGNRIRDIGPLAELKNLELLNISNNYISDLSPLIELERLSSLDICGRNDITDYTPLLHMEYLRELEVYGEEDFDDFDVLDDIN